MTSYEGIFFDNGHTKKIFSDGRIECYLDGKLHNTNGPAVIDGKLKVWYINEKLHRENGPAVIDSESKEWYINGKLHRENGPSVEFQDGHNEWYIKGKLHRTDGPSIEFNVIWTCWYINGERHREDGPAIEGLNGRKDWFMNGTKYTEEIFNFIIKRRRKIMLKFWLKWTDYVMNPNTERGKRYANKQFDKLYE